MSTESLKQTGFADTNGARNLMHTSPKESPIDTSGGHPLIAGEMHTITSGARAISPSLHDQSVRNPSMLPLVPFRDILSRDAGQPTANNGLSMTPDALAPAVPPDEQAVFTPWTDTATWEDIAKHLIEKGAVVSDLVRAVNVFGNSIGFEQFDRQYLNATGVVNSPEPGTITGKSARNEEVDNRNTWLDTIKRDLIEELGLKPEKIFFADENTLYNPDAPYDAKHNGSTAYISDTTVLDERMTDYMKFVGDIVFEGKGTLAEQDGLAFILSNLNSVYQNLLAANQGEINNNPRHSRQQLMYEIPFWQDLANMILLKVGIPREVIQKL